MSADVYDLTVRDAPAGGGLLAQVVEEPTLPPASGVVLLIHGYNNTETAARAAYREFLSLVEPEILERFGKVCRFYWPGDKSWGSVSFLSYSIEIKPAMDTAARLHRFLLGRQVPNGWPLRLALVCHSLGNRVGLELMALLANEPRIQVCMCLMAAAVPVPFVETGGRLSAGVKALTKSCTLHSKADPVLHFAFPPGETLALEGFFPQAIGREGQPLSNWSYQFRMDPYGHSDYWKGWRAARKVAEFLGIPRPRDLQTSSIAAYKTPVAATPAGSSIAVRHTPRRS